MDIRQAYRNIHVAGEEKHRLSLQWHKQIYVVDQVLPFGLISAPMIF